jgi:hypothetical protein
MGKLSQFLLSLVGSRQDSDAVNVPFKAGSHRMRILKWVAAGQTINNWTLIAQLRSPCGPQRGREMRRWLRSKGFKVESRTFKTDNGARVLEWSLPKAERKRLNALLNQPKES